MKIKNFLTLKGTKREVKELFSKMRSGDKFDFRVLVNEPSSKFKISFDLRKNNSRLSKAFSLLDLMKGQISMTVMVVSEGDNMNKMLTNISDKFSSIKFENAIVPEDKTTDSVVVSTIQKGDCKFEKTYRNYISFLLSHERKPIDGIIDTCIRTEIITDEKSKEKFLDTLFEDTAYKYFDHEGGNEAERKRLSKIIDEKLKK